MQVCLGKKKTLVVIKISEEKLVVEKIRDVPDAVTEVVALWSAAAQPVLVEKVLAATEGRSPALSGAVIAGRNVGQHWSLGIARPKQLGQVHSHSQRRKS